MRAAESSAYLDSGKRVTTSLNASNASREAFGSRSVMSGVVRNASGPPCSSLKLIRPRSEEHTSELQSRFDLVCRLLLEKKKSAAFHRGRRGPQKLLRREVLR